MGSCRTMSASRNKLIGKLSRIRLVWQAGLLFRDFLRLTGWLLVAVTCYSIADFFMALEQTSRVTLDIIVAAALTVAGLVLLARVLNIGNRDAARRADSILASRRRPVLSAFELNSWLKRQVNSSDLAVFLARRTIDGAVEQMNALHTRRYFPTDAIAAQFRVLFLQILAAAIIFCPNQTASRTILSRILFPMRDIPPHSLYRFEVSPDVPRVVYGGDAEISVRITGRPVRSQVALLTRHKRSKLRSPCFQEGENSFAQRLERVVSPVEFCFTTGKARSRWHRVNLLLQPQIAIAKATIKSPAYSRLAPRTFFVGNEDFAGLKQSEVELSLTSNRPLLDGRLTIRPKDGLGDELSVPGKRTSNNTVTFTWSMRSPATLELTVRDLQGTRNRDVLEIDQKILPDAPPDATITQPGAFSLATPSIILSLSGTASDDLALHSVELVRAVVGYRDRIRPLGPSSVMDNFSFGEQLDLGMLGVEPGQVLEFYIEATDSNPDLTGVSASDIARVQIISNQEYAQMLRVKTSVEEFLRRYNIAAAELARTMDALRKLQEAIERGDKAEIEKRLKEARAALQRAATLYDKMAADFPIFDVENDFKNVLGKTAQALQEAGGQLQNAAAGDSGLASIVATAMKSLGGQQKRIDGQKATAEEIAMVGAVMECAGRFREIVRRQSELIRRLSRFEKETRQQDIRLLASLELRQKQIRAQLVEFTEDLIARANKLPNKYRKLRSSALQFADRIYAYKIPDLMTSAADSAMNQDGRKAHHYATRALEKLLELMDEGGMFGGMCRGNMPSFNVPKDVMATLSQMLCSAMARGGEGTGQGGTGIGTGGDGDDGYSIGGHSSFNTPVFGPNRMRFPAAGRSGTSGTGPSGAGVGMRLRPAASETMSVTDHEDIGSESMPMEEIPDKYRDAVKRYFSIDEEN